MGPWPRVETERRGPVGRSATAWHLNVGVPASLHPLRTAGTTETRSFPLPVRHAVPRALRHGPVPAARASAPAAETKRRLCDR